jgi:hypothetical protein
MSHIITNNNLSAFLATTGTEAKPTGLGFVTLTAATWYFPIPFGEGLLQSIHVQFDGTIAASGITVEGCNYPLVNPATPALSGVTDYDATAGGIWVPINSAIAGYGSVTASGGTFTVLSLAKTAAAGSAMWNLINPGWARLRLAVVCTTPGTLRVRSHAKD